MDLLFNSVQCICCHDVKKRMIQRQISGTVPYACIKRQKGPSLVFHEGM